MLSGWYRKQSGIWCSTEPGYRGRSPRRRIVPFHLGRATQWYTSTTFDEIEIIKSVDVELSQEGVVMSEHHRNFNSACDAAGLPRNRAKQLVHAFAGGMQGGEFDGRRGILKLGSDKLRNYLQLSLALLARRTWNEFHLRHWTGKTAFLATFRRSLLSGMGCIFDLIERSRSGDVIPTVAAADEIVTLVCQSPLAQTNLRAILSTEISCTDASPSGGGSGTASSFAEEAPGVPEKLAFDGRCGHCAGPLDRASIPGYDCPNDCGLVACCVDCISAHRHSCGRELLGKACFGERFSGPNCPLTKAVALEGIFVQPPLDRLRDGNWDFFSPSGRECLEGMEDDGHLAASHWAPECKTFSAARGRPIWTTSGRYVQGPPRSEEQRETLGVPALVQRKPNQSEARKRHGAPVHPRCQGCQFAGPFCVPGTPMVLPPLVHARGQRNFVSCLGYS